MNQLLFDASRTGFHHWAFPAAGVPIALIGAGLLLIAKRSPKGTGKLKAALGGFVLAVGGAAFTVSSGEGMWTEYTELRSALANHRYQVVQGVVDSLVPEGPGGHPAESWVVAGHRYTISSYVVTSGFMQPGVVRAGDSVRIADVNGTIARLERLR